MKVEMFDGQRRRIGTLELRDAFAAVAWPRREALAKPVRPGSSVMWCSRCERTWEEPQGEAYEYCPWCGAELTEEV